MCVCEQSLEEEECLDKMKGKRTHLRACVNKRVEKKKKIHPVFSSCPPTVYSIYRHHCRFDTVMLWGSQTYSISRGWWIIEVAPVILNNKLHENSWQNPDLWTQTYTRWNVNVPVIDVRDSVLYVQHASVHQCGDQHICKQCSADIQTQLFRASHYSKA